MREERGYKCKQSNEREIPSESESDGWQESEQANKRERGGRWSEGFETNEGQSIQRAERVS